MTLQVSTAYKNEVAQMWKALFDGAVIRVFSGVQPATADLAETGTLLGEITLDGLAGAGLTFEVSGPYITKPLAATWLLTAVASGTATWFRIAFAADSGGDSYTDPRVDGSIASAAGAGVEIVWPTSIVAGSAYPLDAFLYTIPPIIGA